MNRMLVSIAIASSFLVVVWLAISGIAYDADATRIRLSLDGNDSVYLEEVDEHTYHYLVNQNGRTRELSAEEFAEELYRERIARPWWKRLLNITSLAGIAWVALGLAGQLAFSGRMLVQWIVSEKHRRAIIPISFWWLSLVGATMLLAYFIWRKDIVGVLGQGTGWIIYARNLYFIYNEQAVTV